MMFHDAYQVPDQVPASDIKMPSFLYRLRVINTERTIDPTANKERFKENELVKRSKAQACTNAMLLNLADIMTRKTRTYQNWSALQEGCSKEMENVLKRLHNDLEQQKPDQLYGYILLVWLQHDVFYDVCGKGHLFNLNYVLATWHILVLFQEMEHQFRESRHLLWKPKLSYALPHIRRKKKLDITQEAIDSKNEKAMEICAGVFEKLRPESTVCMFGTNRPQHPRYNAINL